MAQRIDEADPQLDEGSISSAFLSLRKGDALTIWCPVSARKETEQETEVMLHPDRPAIIGRASGGYVPYLDPSYQASPIIPGTGKTILVQGSKDLCVSRGHFMLRAIVGGVLLVNGVPRKGGGIRPPLNGTRLVSPQRRPLNPGEEYRIPSGASVVLGLPNDSEVQIQAK